MLVVGDQIPRGDGHIGFARTEIRQNFGEIDRADRGPEQVLGVEFSELFVPQRSSSVCSSCSSTGRRAAKKVAAVRGGGWLPDPLPTIGS